MTKSTRTEMRITKCSKQILEKHLINLIKTETIILTRKNSKSLCYKITQKHLKNYLMKSIMIWTKTVTSVSKEMNLSINNLSHLKTLKITSNFWQRISKLWMKKSTKLLKN
jgi:hypothetical protein